MTKHNIPRLLTAKDVAEILSMSVSTLRKNVSVNPSSVPPFLKLGKASNSPIRWRRSDVDAWIQDQFDASNSSPDIRLLLNKANPHVGT